MQPTLIKTQSLEKSPNVNKCRAMFIPNCGEVLSHYQIPSMNFNNFMSTIVYTNSHQTGKDRKKGPHSPLFRGRPQTTSSAIRKGRGVKKWSKLQTNSTTKLPTWGRGMSKIVKNCQHRLWMVPYVMRHRFSTKVSEFISTHCNLPKKTSLVKSQHK